MRVYAACRCVYLDAHLSAINQVARSLLSNPQDSLLVVCGRLQPDCASQASTRPPALRVDAELAAAVGISIDGRGVSGDSTTGPSRLEGLAVSLPSWGKTDRTSSWQEFADGVVCDEVVHLFEEACFIHAIAELFFGSCQQ